MIAAVENRQTALTFSNSAYCDFSCHPGWAGIVSLAGLARGQKILTVTATDVFGASAQATRGFVFDKPPVLTVAEPSDETVARPTVHLDISCADDDPAGCGVITVLADGTTVASRTGRIDETISLAAFEGRQVGLRIRAQDSAGQITEQLRFLYVDSSPRLTEVDRVPGLIVDVTADRILFLDPPHNGGLLKVRSRATGVDVTIPPVAGQDPQYGFLTPTGAMFVAMGGSVLQAGVYDWRGSGSPINLGYPNSTESLRVAGDYAIWSGEHGPVYTGQPPVLFRRHLPSATNVEVALNAGNWRNDVAENGDVVYWESVNGAYNIFRYRAGITTPLTTDTQLWNTYVVTDGVNAVYRKHTPCCSNQTYAITMYGASGEVTLAPARSQEPAPGRDYAARNGWTAFTRLNGQALQVWVRSPQGVSTQLSFFGSSSQIDVGQTGSGIETSSGAISSDGQVMFVNVPGFAPRRYLASPTRSAVPIGSGWGLSFSLNNQWFIGMGRSLFAVDPDVQPSTMTAVASSLNPAVVGQAVTFTATVNVVPPATGTPTGTVTFFDGATSLGTRMLAASLRATLTTSALGAGVHSITARYSGDAFWSGSTSLPLSQSVKATAGDFDGDGKTDLAVYRKATGEWFIQGSATGFETVTFGAPATSGLGDIPVPRDFDGDGETDLAIYREATGEWFIQGSATGSRALTFGAPLSSGLGDTPVPADFDGDGKADPAIYRKATGEWFLFGSATGLQTRVFGAPSASGLGDVPVPADFDGDGKTDLAIYRQATGEWFIFGSASGSRTVTFGAPAASGLGDIPVPRDFDGDGKADLAIYRQTTGEWLIFGSATGFRTLTFGAPASSGLGDTPVPGDFDGDGSADLAIYRRATAEWLIFGSAMGFQTRVFGAPASSGLGDTPLP
ncbi:MAG TPA: Ig-like domain repeat protein [Candidatus Acidoferrum sp.]|nr:Ig-like domain repeat protein [Candidatus Acidoferrum sp.]